jgi:hypothetical protein
LEADTDYLKELLAKTGYFLRLESLERYESCWVDTVWQVKFYSQNPIQLFLAELDNLKFSR